jgi:dihydroorotate dehydrogenase
MNKAIVSVTAETYQHVLKPLLFRFDAEFVHENMSKFGEQLGKSGLTRSLTETFFSIKDGRLSQTLVGVQFSSPVGLAAGFDYEARLTQISYALGFGFQTVGTITNNPYEGNPRPMLGRLPRSRSLLVNKGFKNPGAYETVRKLQLLKFPIPIGVSIGRTNSASLNQKDSVKDIISAFSEFETSKVKHAYYELNISCPNLFGDVTFYTPENLKELLREIDKLHLKRPVFVKMPIEKTDKEVLSMLDVIASSGLQGVIFGNLQKNRNHPSLIQDEVKKFTKGFFSGKPTYERSNELIALAYKQYKERFIIIGCGGVFSPADAYEKICRGASLIQLITGMIYQGPQLIAQINSGLISLMEKEGIKNISELVGASKE